MTIPVLAREGWRFGGVTKTSAAFVYRTDSSGVNAGVEVSRFPNFSTLVGTVTTGALNAGNNYQATCYVDDLAPGIRYYARAKADDGVGGIVRGSTNLYTCDFQTIAENDSKPLRILGLGCLFGDSIGLNSSKADAATMVAANLIGLRPDVAIALGDVYYPDAGTTRGTVPYGENAWFSQQKGVDDGTPERYRTNFITTMDGNRVMNNGRGVTFGDFFASVPTLYQMDDHDRARDNPYGLRAMIATADVNKRQNGHKVAHEAYMNLNRRFIEAEGRNFATDVLGAPDEPKEWYFVDYPHVRVIVIECWSWRDALGTDSPTYKMISDECEAWLINLIKTNPKKHLMFCSPVMLDGDHNYLTTASNSWKHYSYQRDRILEAIWNYGNPERTVIYSADTHNGIVCKYTGNGMSKPPIYEFMVSNCGWFNSAHGWNTGIYNDVFRAGETGAASGSGGKIEFVHLYQNNCAVFDYAGGELHAQVVETQGAQSSYVRNPPKVVYSRVFR